MIDNKTKDTKPEVKVDAQASVTAKNETVIDNQIYKLDEDATFLSTDIKMTVMGYSYSSKWDDANEEYIEDRNSFQLQTAIFNPENQKLEKHTIKLHKKINDEKILEDMVNKTYHFKAVQVHNIKNENGFGSKTAYSSQGDYEEIKSSENIFEVNASTTVMVSNLLTETRNERKQRKGGKPKTVQVETGNTLLQAIVQQGSRIDVKTIKLIDIVLNEVEGLLNKTVTVEMVQAFKGSNGMVYSTPNIPKVK